MKKKIIGIILSMVMLFTIIPALVITAGAETKTKVESVKTNSVSINEAPELLDIMKAIAIEDLRNLVYKSGKKITERIEHFYKAAVFEIKKQKSKEDVLALKNKWKEKIIAEQKKDELNEMSPREMVEGVIGTARTLAATGKITNTNGETLSNSNVSGELEQAKKEALKKVSDGADPFAVIYDHMFTILICPCGHHETRQGYWLTLDVECRKCHKETLHGKHVFFA